jgi:hypothetical protein
MIRIAIALTAAVMLLPAQQSTFHDGIESSLNDLWRRAGKAETFLFVRGVIFLKMHRLTLQTAQLGGRRDDRIGVVRIVGGVGPVGHRFVGSGYGGGSR